MGHFFCFGPTELIMNIKITPSFSGSVILCSYSAALTALSIGSQAVRYTSHCKPNFLGSQTGENAPGEERESDDFCSGGFIERWQTLLGLEGACDLSKVTSRLSFVGHLLFGAET